VAAPKIQPRDFTFGMDMVQINPKNGTATHSIMAFAQPLLVVGCTNHFALCTKQKIGLGCAKGQ
jgi:hypothetical protein